jgi:VanZ family protein
LWVDAGQIGVVELEMIDRLLDATNRSPWAKVAAAFCVLVIVMGSLLPQAERISSGLPGKLEHFVAYSVTGLLLGLTISNRNGPTLAAIGLACLAFLLEFLQQWSPGRHPRVSDAVVGVAAAMLGASLSAWLNNSRPVKSEQSPK